MAIKLMRYRGFLLRIIRSPFDREYYEWTIQPITNDAKARVRRNHNTYYYKNQFRCNLDKHDKSLIVYDPTSMPTVAGAIFYGRDMVDSYYIDTKLFYHRGYYPLVHNYLYRITCSIEKNFINRW